jgi:hypothetical protein
MNDRELLELAANAQGWIDYPNDPIEAGAHWFEEPEKAPFGIQRRKSSWNPLENDADALRLSVKLGINVLCLRSTGSTGTGGNGNTNGGGTGSAGGPGNTTETGGATQSSSSSGSGGTANSVSNAAEATSSGSSSSGGSSGGSSKNGDKNRARTGALIGTGDIVAVRSAEEGEKDQFKFTMSMTKSNTKNTFARGFLGNFTTQINNSNITFYGAWTLPKSKTTIIIAIMQ